MIDAVTKAIVAQLQLQTADLGDWIAVSALIDFAKNRVVDYRAALIGPM